jgi:hypothetical protein
MDRPPGSRLHRGRLGFVLARRGVLVFGHLPPSSGRDEHRNAHDPAPPAAAFNRSTLLIDSDQPDDENPADYYTNAVTNH